MIAPVDAQWISVLLGGDTEKNYSSLNNGTYTSEGADLDGSILNSGFITFLTVAPSISSMLLQMSPTLSVYGIYKDKSTKELSILPYLCLIVNNTVWGLYGLFVSNYALIGPNLFGALLAVFFSAVFHFYASKEKRRMLYVYEAFVVMMLAGIGYCAINFNEAPLQRVEIFSAIGLLSYFLFLLSPCVSLYHVIKSKSVDSLPFDLCFVLLINCCLWLSQTIFVNGDFPLLVTSIVGIGTSSAQLLCHFIYGDVRASLKTLFLGCCLAAFSHDEDELVSLPTIEEKKQKRLELRKRLSQDSVSTVDTDSSVSIDLEAGVGGPILASAEEQGAQNQIVIC